MIYYYYSLYFLSLHFFFYFFFNDPATTEIYTLSLHDALPICATDAARKALTVKVGRTRGEAGRLIATEIGRAHVELQSRRDLVCRLLLEKKKKKGKKSKTNKQ